MRDLIERVFRVSAALRSCGVDPGTVRAAVTVTAREAFLLLDHDIDSSWSFTVEGPLPELPPEERFWARYDLKVLPHGERGPWAVLFGMELYIDEPHAIDTRM